MVPAVSFRLSDLRFDIRLIGFSIMRMLNSPMDFGLPCKDLIIFE